MDYYHVKDEGEAIHEHSTRCVNVRHHRGCFLCRGKPYRKVINKKARASARSRFASFGVVSVDEFVGPEKYDETTSKQMFDIFSPQIRKCHKK